MDPTDTGSKEKHRFGEVIHHITVMLMAECMYVWMN